MIEPVYLANDVFFCTTQGYGVFLDLRRDAYSAVKLEGVAGDGAPGRPRALDPRLGPHRAELIAAELLTTDPANATFPAPAPIEPVEGHVFGLDDQRAFGLVAKSFLAKGPEAKDLAAKDLAAEDMEDEAAGPLRIGLWDLIRFYRASWRASHNLKTQHIAEIVRTVRRRKARAGEAAIDLAALRRQTAIFRRLRPWYPRDYLCLFDSLALVEFLAPRGLFPLWVFAVQAQPFGAHCWVQAGRLLLNEGSEYAGQFTPIMAV
jgi:hypothetical protein